MKGVKNMQVQLTFRRLNPTFEIEEQIFKEARRLEPAFPQKLTWCHVLIEQPHRHRQRGRPYRVSISVQGLLGYHIASSASDIHVLHDDPRVAITNAFRALRNQMRTKSPVRERLHHRQRFHGQEAQTWD